MDESSLRSIIQRLGVDIPPSHYESEGWLHCECPLAPWTHTSGSNTSSSFSIKIENDGISAFVCMRCKHHGRISSLARAMQHFSGVDYSELALEADTADLQGLVNMPDYENRVFDASPKPLDQEMYVGMFDSVYKYPAAVNYLASRGTMHHTVEKAGIQFDPSKGRVIFPVHDYEGELYGWTGRSVVPNAVPKILDYAGLPKRHLILGQDLWHQGRKTLLVEGLFAYSHMLDIQVDSFVNVGALLGSSLTVEKANRLKSFDAPVVLLLDNDEAGNQGLWDRLDNYGRVIDGAVSMLCKDLLVQVPEYPEGINDPDYLNFDQVKTMCDRTPIWIG